MTDNLETWTGRIAWMALVGIVIGGISWAGWMTIEMNNKVSHIEVESDIRYNNDRTWLISEIETLKVNDNILIERVNVLPAADLRRTIQDNTNAIIQLREQMKFNNQVLETVIRKMDMADNRE